MTKTSNKLRKPRKKVRGTFSDDRYISKTARRLLGYRRVPPRTSLSKRTSKVLDASLT